MRYLIRFIILSIFFNCCINDIYALNNNCLNYVKEKFDTSRHFYSLINKSEFDSLSGTEFTWAIFKPMNDTIQAIGNNSIVQSFSNGQKTLFYIWELERAVIGGPLGFPLLWLLSYWLLK